jgi:hypothetical protein
MSRQYRTSKGRIVDMDQLRIKNENSTAVGNMNVNSRGDKIGPGGKVTEYANARARAYYKDNPKAVKTISIKEDSSKNSNNVNGNDLDIQENMPIKKESKKTISKNREVELDDGSIKIIEDNDAKTK